MHKWTISIAWLIFITTQTIYSNEVRVSFRGDGGGEVILLDYSVEIRKKIKFERGRQTGYEYALAFSTVKHSKEIYIFCDGKVGRRISVFLNDQLVARPVLTERISNGRFVVSLKEEQLSEIKKILSIEVGKD